jgi:AcrR family transcriptional regulator
MKILESKLPRRERERQARKLEIIEASESLFLKNGFEGTSMDDIAKESQFAKGTIYQYFVNKEDLFFAVALKLMKQLDQNLKERFKKGKTAYEKLRLSSLSYYQFNKEHPDIFKLINYNPPSNPDKEISPNYKEFMKFHNTVFQMYTEILEEGKRDGSFPSDLDAKRAAHFAVITVIGFLNTIASASNAYFEEKGFEKDAFIKYGLDLLIDTIVRKTK